MNKKALGSGNTSKPRKLVGYDSEGLFNHISFDVQTFLEIPPHQQVDLLISHLPEGSPLQRPLLDLHGLLFKKRSKDDSYLNDELRKTLRSKQYSEMLHRCFYLIVTKIYLDPDHSPLRGPFVSAALEKSKLGSKSVKRFLNLHIGQLVHGESKRGRSTMWTEEKLLDLLARYNRYVQVVKSARSEEKYNSRRSSKLQNEVASKYNIPKRHRDPLWNYQTSPSDVALDWILKDPTWSRKADQESFEYLKKRLKESRLLWKATVPDKDFVLVDVRNKTFFTLYKKDLNNTNLLHFTSVFDR